MSSRAERRRQARADARASRGQPGRTPVMMVGDGIVSGSLPGTQYEARPAAGLPDKVPGEHRFVASATWVLRGWGTEQLQDDDLPKLLDNENMMQMAVWCWDCELPSPLIVPGVPCGLAPAH